MIREYLFFWLSVNSETVTTDGSEEEDQESIVDRIGGLILAAIGLMALLITLALFNVFKKYSTKVHRWYNKIYFWVFWNGSIRYIIESYAAITNLNLERIFVQGLNWSTPA